MSELILLAHFSVNNGFIETHFKLGLRGLFKIFVSIKKKFKQMINLFKLHSDTNAIKIVHYTVRYLSFKDSHRIFILVTCVFIDWINLNRNNTVFLTDRMLKKLLMLIFLAKIFVFLFFFIVYDYETNVLPHSTMIIVFGKTCIHNSL